ncbi:PadR family transcriptional regulator [Breoghania sp. L-A4]|uniref:PadR family transcriptional regulator n=1 Tax=Breoghania sp. L-A4 TaxID=2304600 RepID=UPI0019673BC9|nr:PadR family transcriptional regulator [Breoghania sp. L-A4]
MNVRSLCLAILYLGEATGYEIKKQSTEGSFSHFVDASFGSIYPALARLEADGMVTAREETKQGKPARKVYSITASGREEFMKALAEPQAPDLFRSQFLLIAVCAELVTPSAFARQRTCTWRKSTTTWTAWERCSPSVAMKPRGGPSTSAFIA